MAKKSMTHRKRNYREYFPFEMYRFSSIFFFFILFFTKKVAIVIYELYFVSSWFACDALFLILRSNGEIDCFV